MNSANVVNNLTTTSSGYVLDARVGTTINYLLGNLKRLKPNMEYMYRYRNPRYIYESWYRYMMPYGTDMVDTDKTNITFSIVLIKVLIGHNTYETIDPNTKVGDIDPVYLNIGAMETEINILYSFTNYADKDIVLIFKPEVW